MQTLQKLSDRLYYLPPYQKTDRPILGAVVGDKHTLLIDSGNSANHAKLFKDQLASHQIYGDLLALTHWHWDHVFGLSEMAKIGRASCRERVEISDVAEPRKSEEGRAMRC